jgi:hypothetical protein
MHGAIFRVGAILGEFPRQGSRSAASLNNRRRAHATFHGARPPFFRARGGWLDERGLPRLS